MADQPLKDAFLRNIFSAGGAAAIPARVLFVGQSWPSGADTGTYFTSPQAALTAAAALSPAPSALNRVFVLVAPGTYTENVAIPVGGFITLANMASSGSSDSSAGLAREVAIVGNVSWAATASCQARIDGIKITGTLVASGGASSFLFLTNTTVTGAITLSSAIDVEALDCYFSTGNVTVNAGASFIVTGGVIAGNITVTGASSVMFCTGGAHLQGTVSALVGASFTATGGSYQDTGAGIAVDATSTADIRGADFLGNVFTVAVGGKLNRTLSTQAVASINGANAITFAYPFVTAPQNITLTQVSGSAGNPPIITAITATGFTLTDTAIKGFTATIYHS